MSQDNQRTEPGQEAGGYGTPSAEQEAGGMAKTQPAGRHADTGGNDPGKEPGGPNPAREADVPSAEAGITDATADRPHAESFSSENSQDAAGLPDGSGNDLPAKESPDKDGRESFDAG
ncbi:MAG TPA: hypothetical protein VFI36_04595 [Arthrobacter sp.]|nr:hypothetical protein [Arthrobacter sp.]